jgi:hypothetical protein
MRPGYEQHVMAVSLRVDPDVQLSCFDIQQMPFVLAVIGIKLFASMNLRTM